MIDDKTANKRSEALKKKLEEIRLLEEELKSKNLAQKLGLPYSDLKTAAIDPEALSLLDEESARSGNIAIIFKNDAKLIVAVLDPNNITTQKIISELRKKFDISLVITNPHSLQKILERYRTISKAEIFKIGAIEINEQELDQWEKEIKNVSDIKNKISNLTTTSLLEIIIAGALKVKASDIHLEPESTQARLRYRLDGILHDITWLDLQSYTKITNRIKVLSKMKLNIHNVPQDGRITLHLKSVDIEVRVSVLPSEFGETTVMRLLDPRNIKQKLEDLGIRNDLLIKIKEVLKKPIGAIFTTGPTGSGKTTLLYAFINYLNDPETKIITIEDPIEYHISGISQTQVDHKRGYTFANGLRAIVRQDPDIILVGEIRDVETADIALQAALTGHLVFSTIHTNNAAGTFPRLIDLGIRPPVIAPAINMAIAQRLLRKLCDNCKKIRKVTEQELQKIKKILTPVIGRVNLPNLNENITIGEPGKCEECNQVGYKGRVGIFEALEMTRNMEKLILTSPTISNIQDLAIEEGMITMQQDAYIKLIEKITSLEEIERILGG
jgi:type IV pilus assembly protein PilB